MKINKNNQFGRNYSFFGKNIYLNKANEGQEAVETSQGDKVVSMLTEAEMNNMNKAALERIRAGAYDKMSGAMSVAATPVGIKTLGLGTGIATGLAVKGGMRLAGKSANLETRSTSEIDSLNQKRLGFIDRTIGDFENRIGFVGEKSVKLLRDLKLRLDNIESAINEANSTLEQLKKHEAMMKDLREVKFFDFQFNAFVKEKLGTIAGKVDDFGDKYLRIEKRKGHWGIGRLEKTIASLEQAREKTKQKIANIEGEGSRISELQKKPNQTAEFISENLGMSKAKVQDLINNYLNPKKAKEKGENPNEILTLINGLPPDNPYKKDMQSLVKHLKSMGGKMAEISDMQKIFRDRAEGKEKAKINMARANEMFAKLLNGKIKEGSIIRITKKNNNLLGFTIPGKKLTVTKVLGKKMELVANGKKIIFDLNTGIIYSGSNRAPMRGITSYTVMTDGEEVKDKKEEKGEQAEKTETAKSETEKEETAKNTEAETTEASEDSELLEDAKEIINTFNSSDKFRDKRLSNQIKEFNKDNYGESFENDLVFGEIISITEKDNSDEVLIFFKANDDEVVCDLANSSQAEELKEGDPWTKEAGIDFSKNKIDKKAS